MNHRSSNTGKSIVQSWTRTSVKLPIDSADVLAFKDGYGVYITHYMKSTWSIRSHAKELGEPTFWMELPDGPYYPNPCLWAKEQFVRSGNEMDLC